MAKLKHKHRSPPRRPMDRRKALAKLQEAATLSQRKLVRWQIEAPR